MSDKKEFYRRLAENSLKGVKTQRTIKTTRINTPNHTTRNNDYRNTTKNGMIKFDEQNNTQASSKFFMQCIISILIIGIFYYLSNSNSEIAKNIVSKTKSMINSELNIDNKIDDILSKFNIKTNIGNTNKDGVSIDSEVIEQMEKEIENAPKK
mgnify:CR=1 FL=1